MFVIPWRSGHALAFRRVTIAINCVHVGPIPLLLLLLWLILPWHRRLASIAFRLAEEKVLIGVTADLQIDDVTHVFEILQLVMKLLFFTVSIRFLLALLLLVIDIVVVVLLVRL